MLRAVCGFSIVAVVMAGSAVAETPKSLLAELDPKDPKYESAPCVEARKIGAEFDNHMGGRTLLSVGAALLGPGTMLLDAGGQTAFTTNRQTIVEEIRQRCDSKVSDKKTCKEVDGKIVCE